ASLIRQAGRHPFLAERHARTRPSRYGRQKRPPPATAIASKAGEFVNHLGEAAPLVVRQIGGGDNEAVVFQSGCLGETVPGGRLRHVFWQRFAANIEMSDPVLRD